MTEQSGITDGAVVALSAPVPGATSGGCQWGISYAECDTLGPAECWTPTARAVYEQMAVDYLNAWTGGRYGLCPIVFRPCRAMCPSVGTGYGVSASGFTYGPVLLAGQWYNIACGVCGDICTCNGSAPLRLPVQVASITAITIDGAVLPQASYRVDNGFLLVRTDGEPWPACDGWTVEVLTGAPVPVGGQVAAGVLAVELAKAACGDGSCQLPRRVQTITRQGVTVALLDAFDDVGKGRTGVWLIDSWIASVTGPRRGGSVRSVDIPHPRHRVTTWPPGPAQGGPPVVPLVIDGGAP